MQGGNRSSWVAYVALVLLASVFALPLVWMVCTSLKAPEEVLREPFRLLPRGWHWQNYTEAATTVPLLLYLRNSIVLCTFSVIGAVASSALIAYGFARLRWPGRDVLFLLMVATMLLPFHVTMVPRFVLIRSLGLYDSFAALILPTFLGEAFFIFLLRQFFLTIPEELSEAARLDGCSEWGVFWRIVLPLSRPALATVALFQLLTTWNDFAGPLLYLSDPNKYPLAYGLQQFVSAYRTEFSYLMAAATVFTVPVILLFFLTQRTFIEGISTTGRKG